MSDGFTLPACGHPLAARPKDTRVHIRWMIRRDLPEVLDIESAVTAFPWAEQDFLDRLRQRDCIGMVAEHGERIAGFFVYELHRGHIDVTNLAVTPDYHRQGVGRAMLAKLAGKLSAHRRTRVTVDVRETNLDAHRWLAAHGYWATGVRREHYGDSGEDAFAFEYRIA